MKKESQIITSLENVDKEDRQFYILDIDTGIYHDIRNEIENGHIIKQNSIIKKPKKK